MIKDKGFKKICAILIISAIVLPFAINGIYGFVLKYIPGKMYANDSDVWIGFLGGFLGAGITLLGVYWQINESKKEKKLNEISDTYGAYVLLKKGVDELAGYLTGFKVLFDLNQGLNNELSKLAKITSDNEKEAVKKNYQKRFREYLKKTITKILYITLYRTVYQLRK